MGWELSHFSAPEGGVTQRYFSAPAAPPAPPLALAQEEAAYDSLRGEPWRMSWFPVVLMASAARGPELLHVLPLARPSFSCPASTWGSGAVSCSFGTWRGCRCSERGQCLLSYEPLQLALTLMGERQVRK